MKISAVISRRDIFLVSLLALPRIRSNWYFMAVFGVGAFVFFMMKVPISAINVSIALLLSVFAATSAVLGAFLANSACALLKIEKNSGVLGTHEFSISPTGLQETTSFNDSRYIWSGIQSIERLGSYMLVRINRYMIYVIPRRAFGSDDEFDAFIHQARAWKLTAEGSEV